MGKKYKVLALFGKSSSGKSTILEWIVRTQKDMNKIIPYTTREKRDNERNGKDYYFITENEFTSLFKEDRGSLIDIQVFNKWRYATSIDFFMEEKINVGVFNMLSIKHMLIRKEEFDVLPVYIDCYDKIRLIRSILREKNPDCNEICRRFLADEQDFKNIWFDYITFDNSINDDSDYFGIMNIPEIADFINQK